MEDLEKVKASLKGTKKLPVARGDFLSTGHTVLNCACSGLPDGAFPKGTYVLLAGKSDSGKTWISFSSLAEATLNKRFDGYQLVYYAAENGALMDIEHFFGKKLKERLVVKEPTTLEEFYYDLDTIGSGERPYIAVLDSMDGLIPGDLHEQFQKEKKAFEKGKEVSGSFGTAKAKINSQNLPRVNASLKKSGSILIIISQSRDNIGWGAQYNPETRAGGRALSFYAQMEIWFSPKEKMKKTVRGKDRTIGTLSKVTVKRTRVTGRQCSVEVPIYYSFGIDDIGSCIDFLVEEKHWLVGGKTINAQEFPFVGTREGIIKKIEETGTQEELREVVGKVWRDIEEACALDRKRKYE